MQYLTPQLTQEVIVRLKTFENELCEVFKRYGYDLRDNLGRRNQLVSQAQEKEFARSLRKVYKNVVEDGAPGRWRSRRSRCGSGDSRGDRRRDEELQGVPRAHASWDVQVDALGGVRQGHSKLGARDGPGRDLHGHGTHLCAH